MKMIVLDGAHKGFIANVTKLKKFKKLVELKSDDGEVWQEPLDKVYFLEPHKDSGCDCE